MDKNLNSHPGVPLWLRIVRFTPIIIQLIDDIFSEIKSSKPDFKSETAPPVSESGLPHPDETGPFDPLQDRMLDPSVIWKK